MKKTIALILAALMLLCTAAASAEVKLGQVDYAAHGTKCFAVLTVAVDGDTIVAAHIDEFQPMDAASAQGVPNSEAIFADMAAEGKVLGSKRVNNGMYSTNMKNNAGATQPLGVSYDLIEAFVIGKTIAEVEAAIEGKDSAAFLETDTVAGCTLADTLGYVTGLVEAAKAASLSTGYYTIYNKTGEALDATLTNNATGEVMATVIGLEADAAKVITATVAPETSFTLAFVTTSGYAAQFDTLHVETTAITLLDADTCAGATPLSFFAPEN